MEAMTDQRPPDGTNGPPDNPDDKDERYVRDNLLDKARRTLGRVGFVENAVAAYYCAIDSKTPTHVKAIIIGALGYFIMPIDVVPDIIALLGFTDDATVFYLAWRKVAEHVTEDHRRQAREFLDGAGNSN